MPIIRGEPGTSFTNDTGKILWQAHCDFQRSCARCIALHHAIGPYFPFPLHDRCNCTQHPIKPGQTAAPFIDYQEEVAKLGPAGQRHAMGASNWRLVASGVAKWGDVVTPGRIRDFREVVDRLDLSVNQLVKAGVARARAVRAYDATHTAGHAHATAERQALVQGLRGHGVNDKRIAAELGSLLAGRFGVEGPGGGGQLQPPPPPPPAPKPRPIPVPKPSKPTKEPEPFRPVTAAGRVSRAIGIAREEGVEVYGAGHDFLAAVNGDKVDQIAAAYLAVEKNKGIYINEKSSYWADLERIQAAAHKRGWFSSDSPDHVIHHEIGHALHDQAGAFFSVPLSFDDQTRALARKVSIHAASKPVEFVAEVYAGMKAGKKYDDDIMDLYRKFGGPGL